MSSRTSSFQEGGPPDPIAFLRRLSGDEDMRRSDSADDILSELNDEAAELSLDSPGDGPPSPRRLERNTSGRRKQDPPARERPLPGQPWPYRDTLSFTRTLIFYGAGSITHEHERACKQIQEARKFRQKYLGSSGTKFASDDVLKEPDIQFGFGEEGVIELYSAADVDKTNNLCQVPNGEDFNKDYRRLVDIANDGSMRSFCFQRLQLLSSAFRMHVTMNGPAEATEQSNLLGTDFYRTFKIDNHIHAAAAPTARMFVNFVAKKLETEPDTVVSSDGKTLKEVFETAGIDKDALTIDAFNVLADYSVYQRFDNFNAKYSPFRMADLRRIFLKTTNHMGGRYFAELMKLVLSRHEESKGHKSGAEMRLSIYGMEAHEWQDLAEWMLKDWGGEFPGPVISQNNRWLIQIPRLWRIYSNKPGASDRSYIEMLENIFKPMFEATLYPEKYPKIAECLTHIVGIDSVDDEGEPEVCIQL
jgi:AMP deaminase